jgi:hypothetical protein
MRKFRFYFLAVSSFEIGAITEIYVERYPKTISAEGKPEGGHSVTCAYNKKKKGQPQTLTRIMVQTLTNT